MSDLSATVAAVRARNEFARNAPTRVQVRIVEFVRDYRLEHGVGPTFDEIAAALGVASKGSISRHVRALVARRALRDTPGAHRSLAVAPEHPVMLDMPDDIFAEIWVEARRENVSFEALVIKRLRESLDARPSKVRVPSAPLAPALVTAAAVSPRTRASPE